ncbi:AAA family ATPase [Winogradskyella sp. MIT101101]|uniref:AAA family ATPase n=1 Tax=Winogradskyella sp. MIT101101 TaxID=3098297 RepID=UPI00399BBB51
MFFHFDRPSVDYPKEIVENKTNLLYEWEIENDNKVLEINKINLFVGANNSGKSRFLRGILKTINDVDLFSKYNNHFDEIRRDYNSYYQLNFGNLHPSFRNEFNSRTREFPFTSTNLKNLVSNITKYESSFSFINRVVNKLNDLKALGRLNLNQEKELKFLKKVELIVDELNYLKSNKPSHKKYIPILRTLHENQYLTEGVIKNTIKINYDIDGNVFTGLTLYKKILGLKNSPGPNRKKVKQFEKFLSKHFFDKKEVEITSNSETNELLFSVDDLEHPVYDLGDGIQSLIILLFPIFTANKNDWFFIEEPEINLHPGLQRIFIQTLLYDEYLKEKKLRYFFTTHSNHFLDITLLNDNISIFQFEKNEKDTFRIRTNVKPSKDVLDVLGVNTSSVFLANTSIWVEGPTDRKYISKLLSLLFEKKNQFLKEDIDYSFFEYGGNLIEHYLFDNNIEFNEVAVREKINSFALSNKIYLLADNDNVDMRSAKGKRRKLLEESAKKNPNFMYQNTELREIENLLPKAIIKGFLRFLVKDLEDIDLVNAIDFNKSDYNKVGLGEFYETLLLDNNIPKKTHKAFKADSGTLKNDYKIKLADFVINSEYKYDDFIEDNDTLKTIIENLYKFIKK